MCNFFLFLAVVIKTGGEFCLGDMNKNEQIQFSYSQMYF